MSALMMVKAWETTNLTPSERLVLLALADCSDRDGLNAYRSERTIAEHTQLGLRTVKAAVAALKVKGHIAVQELPTNRRSTTYRLFPGMGADSAPQRDRVGGAAFAPRMGAGSAPLGVQLGVQKMTARGAESAFPPTPPDKEEPVFDPVEPAAVPLIAKLAIAMLDGVTETSRQSQVTDLRRLARSRGWPHDARTIEAALDMALDSLRRRS